MGKKINREFSKELQMVNKYIKKCSYMIYLIHCKNLCTCYNVPSPIKTIKEKIFYKNVQHPCQKGNVNQNNTEILSHPSQNGYHQENKQPQMLAKVQEKETLIHT
jgi:hypothetical protein